jgi:hypothetical protein
MPKVFISHSSRNREIASALKEELAMHSISCWIAPDDISLGQTWEDAIADAIAVAPAFIILWSKYSQNSLHVKRELSLAASQDKAIIPLRLDDEVPRGAFAYYLTNKHWRLLTKKSIQRCCVSIKDQICSTGSLSLRNSLEDDSGAGGPCSQATEPPATDSSQIKEGLDVTHTILVSPLQSKQGHTRILKIGIGEAGESLEVRVPAGIKNGTRLRLKGKGNQSGTSGLRGDLYLRIKIMDS